MHENIKMKKKTKKNEGGAIAPLVLSDVGFEYVMTVRERERYKTFEEAKT